MPFPTSLQDARFDLVSQPGTGCRANIPSRSATEPLLPITNVGEPYIVWPDFSGRCRFLLRDGLERMEALFQGTGIFDYVAGQHHD
jgi:hypothetical protein